MLDAVAGLLGVTHDELGALALEAEPGADGVVLVPWFEGERTPNLPNATASLTGLTLASTTRPTFARAAIEGMLSGLAVGLEAIQAQGVEVRRVLLIGGAAANDAVARIAAQVFDAGIVVPAAGEYVALGAARQAAGVLAAVRWTGPWRRPARSIPTTARSSARSTTRSRRCARRRADRANRGGFGEPGYARVGQDPSTPCKGGVGGFFAGALPQGVERPDRSPRVRASVLRAGVATTAVRAPASARVRSSPRG